MQHIVATLGLIGLVIVVAALLSSAVERLAIPLVGAFLLLGVVVGPHGLGLTDIGLRSTELAVLATLGLTMVLFTDAVTVNIREFREHKRLAWIVLVPGTLLPAALIAAAAWWLLGVPVAGAAILGAALASTDPVLLRSVLRAPRLPSTARLALRIESGMNDAMLLPLVVLAMVAMRSGTAAETGVSRHLLGLFVLGPALGAFVGWAGITMLASVRSRIGVRRDYESLYAIGLGVVAYAAAEAVGGSGFLAAFAAGLAIAALDVELCDCFLEYGEATAEMLLLLTFVALGASLIWRGFAVADVRSIAFTVVALFVRTLVLFPALALAGVRGRDRRLIAWFGPRGLSSLLLVLLPVFADLPGADYWFEVTCLVVMASLVTHGAIVGAFLRREQRPDRRALNAPSVASSPDDSIPERITIAEVRALQERGDDVVFVDARAPRAFEADDRQIAGAVRVPPDDAVRAATEQKLSQQGTLVVYCA